MPDKASTCGLLDETIHSVVDEYIEAIEAAGVSVSSEMKAALLAVAAGTLFDHLMKRTHMGRTHTGEEAARWGRRVLEECRLLGLGFGQAGLRFKHIATIGPAAAEVARIHAEEGNNRPIVMRLDEKTGFSVYEMTPEDLNASRAAIDSGASVLPLPDISVTEPIPIPTAEQIREDLRGEGGISFLSGWTPPKRAN